MMLESLLLVAHETHEGRLIGSPDVLADKDLVVNYLESCPMVFPLMEATVDQVDQSRNIMGGSSFVTDGTFIWRNEVAYYVSRYDLQLPAVFLSHIRSRDHVAPDLSREIQLDLEEEIASTGVRFPPERVVVATSTFE